MRCLFIITDKVRPTGGRRSTGVGHYERQKGKARGDEIISHTRWSSGRSCPGEREGDRV